MEYVLLSISIFVGVLAASLMMGIIALNYVASESYLKKVTKMSKDIIKYSYELEEEDEEL